MQCVAIGMAGWHMDMGGRIMVTWLLLAIFLLWNNLDEMCELPVWRQVVASVILIVGAPVFFLSDLGEALLILLMEEEDEDCN